MAAINLDISTKLDITCRRNDTFSLEVIFNDADGNGLALDEYTSFIMQVRRHDRKSGNPTIEFDSADGDIAGDSNGKLTITKSAANMNISGGQYVYDLQATKSGITSTWLRGLFIINEDVTI
jgi:uncharacterized protein (DUF2235 family)